MTYSVKQSKDLISGSHIKNSANIYFDHNLPIITNTARHRVYGEHYPSPVNIENTSKNENEIKIFPNPSNGSVIIVFGQSMNNAVVTLSNLFGQIQIKKSNVSGERLLLDILGQTKGIYFLEIWSNEKRTVGKIVLN